MTCVSIDVIDQELSCLLLQYIPPLHLQAIYGILLFGEIVPLSWYFGATLIALGMWLLSSVTLVEVESNKSHSH